MLRAAELWSLEAQTTSSRQRQTARARAVELLIGLGSVSWQPHFWGVKGALMDAWLEGVIPSAVECAPKLQLTGLVNYLFDVL